ncbi:hypothetical protein B0I35DRAFT_480825 [Stachybotrys elegans]|uniref:Uncharacterized protein n=1 Tax=Stachybotrys elegans TaxID=80388 RepID=A0A8K0WQ77_9HYPO|nr:hypothetical protein B0I35DRAFT_480825 [Stachybotrys elegans]
MKASAVVSVILAAVAPLADAAPTVALTNVTEPLAPRGLNFTNIVAREEPQSRDLKPQAFKFRRDAKTGNRQERSFANGIAPFNSTAF